VFCVLLRFFACPACSVRDDQLPLFPVLTVRCILNAVLLMFLISLLAWANDIFLLYIMRFFDLLHQRFIDSYALFIMQFSNITSQVLLPSGLFALQLCCFLSDISSCMHAHRTFSTARLLTASASRCAHLPAGPLSTLRHCNNPFSARPCFLQHAVLDSASSLGEHICFFTICSIANPCTSHSLL